jgi:hypothetical protein
MINRVEPYSARGHNNRPGGPQRWLGQNGHDRRLCWPSYARQCTVQARAVVTALRPHVVVWPLLVVQAMRRGWAAGLSTSDDRGKPPGKILRVGAHP